MENITKFQIVPLTESRFVQPYRILYTQDGKEKIWDAVKSHDSVGILIYNTSVRCFVLVKQFRPVVYQSQLRGDECQQCLPPGSLGITYEVCAGIVDKDKSPVEIAVDEVWEECGYRVDASRMECISTLRSGVGLLGSSMSLFYVRVTDADKCGVGGGLASEGEMIELHLLPRDDVELFISDDRVQKPTSLMFALLWFMQYRSNRD